MKGHSLSSGLALVVLLAVVLFAAWAPGVWADGSAEADTATTDAATADAVAGASDREPVRARRLFVPTNLAGKAGADKADPTFPFALGDLPSQGTLTVTYEVEVDAAATWVNTPVTQICNQATLASTNHGAVASDDPDTGAASDTTCTPVDAADLAITKTDDVDPVDAGGTLIYTITVSNAGPQTAAGVVVTDTLPAGVSLVSTAGCAESPGAGVPTCTLGSIPSGGMAQYTVTVTVGGSVADGTMLTNSVGVTSLTSESNPGNETASEVTTVQASADLTITKTDDVDPVVAGQNLTYTVTVSNSGPSDAVGVVVTDTLPAGGSLVSTSGCAEDPAAVPTCTLGTIVSGGMAQYTITVTVDSDVADGTMLTNNASVAATTSLTNTGDDSTSETTTVDTQADLVITKVDDADPVVAGNNLTYTVTVSNNGPSDAVGVVATDTLPAGVSLVSTAGCAESPGAGVPTCTLGTIASGGMSQYTIVVAVDSDVTDGSTLTNNVSVAATTTLINTGDDSTSEDTSVATEVDLVITKVDDVDPVVAGENLTYTVEVTNNGPSDAVGVNFSDTLPAGVTLVSTSGCNEDPNGVPTCTLGDIASGASAQATITVTVDSDTTGTLTNNVTVDATTTRINTGDDSASEDTAVSTEADLVITKTDDVDPVNVAANLTYTIEVSNSGPSDADGVVVTDTLPGDVTFVSTTGCAEDPNTAPGGVVTCTLGTVTAGGSEQFTLTVTVDPVAMGTLTNNASVAASTTLINTGDDSTSEDTGVNAEASLSLTKGDAPDPVVAGEDLTYTLSVENLGPGTALDVEVCDLLPPGTLFDAGASDPSCSQPVDLTGLRALLDPANEVPPVASLASGSASFVLDTTTNELEFALHVANIDNLTAAHIHSGAAGVNGPVVQNLWLGAPPPFGPADPIAGTIQLTAMEAADLLANPHYVNVHTSDFPGGEIRGQIVVTAETPVRCDVGTVNASSTTPVSIVATVAASVPTGTVLTNVGMVQSSTLDPDRVVLAAPNGTGILRGDTALATTTVATSADLSITKTDSVDPVTAGTNLVYTVTVDNAGPSDAQDVVVTDTLPAGVSLVSTSGCAEDPAGVPTCTLGTVAAGGSAMFTVTVAVAPGTTGTLTNSVSVASSTPEENPGDESTTEDTAITTLADLAVSKTDDVDPVVAGENVTYTITVSNSGPSDAIGVVATDTLPAGTGLVSTSGCVEDPAGVPTCTLGAIAAGGMAQYQVTVTVDADVADGSVLTNMVAVGASTPLTNTGDDSTSETTTVAAEADLSITKVDDVDPVVAGENLTYTLEVSNAGPSDAQGVEITDTLPTGVTLVSTTGCVEDPTGVPTCTVGTVAAGASAQVTVVVTVDADVADGSTLTNGASVTASTTLTNTGDDSTSEDTLVATEADLTITKTDDVDPVVAGENLTYTIEVSNAGPSDAQGVVVSDTLPAGVTFVSSAGCSEDPTGVPTCTLGTIAAGASAMATITVTVDPSTTGSITNNASVAATTTLINTGDDSTSEDTAVTTEADLSVAKVDSQDPVNAGEPLSYTITVSNAGPSDAQAVQVTEMLPAGVTFVSTSGCAEDPAGVPTCTLGTIAAGQMAVYTVDVTVDGGTAGLITNNVTVSSSTTDPVPGNDTTSEDTLVEPTADLSIDKIDSEDPVANPTFTYTLEVTNNGPSEATGVEATDTLPAGIVFDSSPDGCTELAGVVTCPFGTIANGATVSRSFVVALDPPFPAILSNTATVNGDQADQDPSNDSDTEETTLDVVPPQVTDLTTDYQAGDDVLDECETLTRVGVRAFEVTFSEPVFDPAGDSDPDDVTNPDNFVIVAPGADRDFQTTVCGPPVGDDVAIGIDAVIYDDGTQSAEVDLTAGLADDLYRLLICGSTSIVDQAGNSLDGDGDGTGGDDFERNFRLDVDNRFANGHFDCDLAEWDVLVTNAAELTHSTEDYEGADSSGSARFENLTASGLFQLSQCLDLPAIRGYEISGFARVSTPVPDEVAIGRFCEPFDGPACGGASLGEIASLVAGGTPDVWVPFGRTFDMPAAAQSARCGVRVTTGTGADFVVLFDGLTFRNLDGAFSDGFESGDVSAWSDSEP